MGSATLPVDKETLRNITLLTLGSSNWSTSKKPALVSVVARRKASRLAGVVRVKIRAFGIENELSGRSE